MDRIAFPCEYKFTDEGAGTIEGYASVFNLLDRGGDIVLPGAFKASLGAWRKKKQAPPMLWQHDPYEPIGIWTDVAEDDKGLKVKGEFTPDDPTAQVVRARIKHGSVKALSIGYRTLEDEIDRTTGARRLKKVDLWEISPVTFPMLPEAQISGVKSDMLAKFNPRELEEALREAGLSRADAKKGVDVFRKSLQREAGEQGPAPREAAKDVLMELRKASELLRA
jgi:HK97 family phage prohead protease